MKKLNSIKVLCCVLAVGATVVNNGFANLPMFDNREWIGYYQIESNKKFAFGITPQGQGKFFAMDNDGQPLIHSALVVDFLIEEVTAGGLVTTKGFSPEFLESEKPAGADIKDVTIKGKAEDDILFELTLTEDRGGMLLGGKVTSPGKAQNPLRLSIRVWVPDVTPYFTEKKEEDEKKAKKEMEKLLKGERLSVKWINGKSERPSTSEPIDASSSAVSGPGISALSAEFSKLGGAKLDITAAPNSAMTLSNDPSKALIKGFSVIWRQDIAKDPLSKARLSLVLK